MEAVQAVFESQTTALSAWDLDTPPIMCEYGGVRRRFSDWKRNKQLVDNDRACHETRVLVDIVSSASASRKKMKENAKRLRVYRQNARMCSTCGRLAAEACWT